MIEIDFARIHDDVPVFQAIAIARRAMAHAHQWPPLVSCRYHMITQDGKSLLALINRLQRDSSTCVLVGTIKCEFGREDTSRLLDELASEDCVFYSGTDHLAVSLSGKGKELAKDGAQRTQGLINASKQVLEEQRRIELARERQDKRILVYSARQVGTFQLCWAWQAIEHERQVRAISTRDWPFNRSRYDTKLRQLADTFAQIVSGQAAQEFKETVGSLEGAELVLARYVPGRMSGAANANHRISCYFQYRGEVPGIVTLSRRIGAQIVGINAVIQQFARLSGLLYSPISLYETACFLRIVSENWTPRRGSLRVEEINSSAANRLLENGVRPTSSESLSHQELMDLYQKWSDIWTDCFILCDPYMRG